MHTIHTALKNKLLLSIILSSMMGSTLIAKSTKPTYAEIKLKLMKAKQNYSILQREYHAKNRKNRNIVYISHIENNKRERVRVCR
ncbi:MAG: hypothetical protein K0U47_03290 [Epsilonproteobacteria bacterium]|nr:hypothetical protein [Campylobacterota bacterium]